MAELKQIGVYRVLRSLGGGGMGVVYLVEEQESGSLYALKLLSPSLSPSEREVRRFRREFMTMSRLRHPNIVEVYESGLHNGSLFFVMEYIQGANLRAHFVPGDPPEDPIEQDVYFGELSRSRRVKKVVKGMQQVCEALAWIHDLNIVHRDLKPENLLYTPDDKVKLLDFGIAKRLGGPEYSQAHSIMGTFTYISPEQAQCEEVDGRSDLYSLGVILYELLTGRPPFMSAEPIGRLYMHLNKPAPPLSEFNPRVDSYLEAVVMQLLQKDPRHRYQRAEDLYGALEVFLQGRDETSVVMLDGRGFPGGKSVANPKFVGRQSEFQSLVEATRPSPGRMTTPLVLLSGNMGMGKTRLAREFLSSARVQRVECCTVRCLPEAPPYMMYQELMEQLRVGVAMRVGRDVDEWWGKAGETWFRLMAPNIEDDAAGLDTINSTTDGAEEEKFLLFDVARQILEMVLQEISVVFFVDDLMYVDEMSLELTEYLVRALASANVMHRFMLLGAFRNEDVDMQHSLNQMMLRLASDRLYHLYDLKPLGEEEVVEMATSMLGSSPTSEARKHLIQQSQCNPFFAEELIKAWFEEQLIAEERGQWKLLEGAMEEEQGGQRGVLPVSIRKRLVRRLEKLSGKANDIAQWIAVLGQEATFELLLELMSFSEMELLPYLDELQQQKIIFEDWSMGTERYQFSHPGIQEAIYLRIDDDRRKKYHLIVAQGLKRSAGRDDAFELLAHHFLAAGEEEQGAWYMLLAAEQQLRAFAHRSAWDLVKRCRALLAQTSDDVLFQPGSSWWWRYHQVQLELFEWMGSYAEGLELANYALQQLSGQQEAVLLLRWQASFYRQMGRYQEAMDCIQRAIAWGGDEGERLYIMQEAGKIYRVQGRYGAALEAYREALAWSVSKMKVTEQGRLAGMIGRVLHLRGEFEEARQHYDKGLDIAVEAGDRRGEIEGMCKLGTLELDQGDVMASLERFEKAISLAQELGDRRMECTALQLLGQLQADRRLYKDAQQKLEAALTLAVQFDDQRTEGELLGRLGVLCYRQKRFPSARMYLEEGLQKLRAVGDQVNELWLNCFLCVVELVLENRGGLEVLADLEKTLEWSEEMEALDVVLLCKVLIGHVHRLLGEKERALDYLVSARYLALEIGNRRLLARIESERYYLSEDKGLVWGRQGQRLQV